MSAPANENSSRGHMVRGCAIGLILIAISFPAFAGSIAGAACAVAAEPVEVFLVSQDARFAALRDSGVLFFVSSMVALFSLRDIARKRTERDLLRTGYAV